MALRFTLRAWRSCGIGNKANAGARGYSDAVRGQKQSGFPPRGWRKYAELFKDKPASHLVSFIILHEVTAILPLPAFYLLYSSYLPDTAEKITTYLNDGKPLDSPVVRTVDENGEDLPPGDREEALNKAAKRMAKVIKTFGLSKWIPLDEEDENGGKKMVGTVAHFAVNAAAAYWTVKILLPVRIAASIWLTPGFARVFIIPVGRLFTRRK
ncbi:hypothetical protein BJ742DRAFT_771985 [Cladochytrium replicatum]|nr:hypothetical protein BJ742DRAFT_771985 [Cladochytrium replicatum]